MISRPARLFAPLAFALLGALLGPTEARAALTSDFDSGLGITNFRIQVDGNVVNFESPMTLNFSYNVNYVPLNMALNLTAMESLESNQGNLNFTRLGAGLRVYPLGMNGSRIVIDSKTEARKFKPSPYVGMNMGLSNFSILRVSSDKDQESFFNMVGIDAHLVGGNDLSLSPNLFLTAQVVLGLSLQSSARAGFGAVSYSGIGLFVGLKLASF